MKVATAGFGNVSHTKSLALFLALSYYYFTLFTNKKNTYSLTDIKQIGC